MFYNGEEVTAYEEQLMSLQTAKQAAEEEAQRTKGAYRIMYDAVSFMCCFHHEG